MDYSGTLRRGWEIVWRNKWLWLLALLSLPSLLSIGQLVTTVNIWPVVDFPAPSPSSSSNIPLLTLLQERPVFDRPTMLLRYLVSLAVLVVKLIAQGGLIYAVAQWAQGEAPSFGRSFKASWRRLLPLLGMTILLCILPVMMFFASTLIDPSVIFGDSAYMDMWSRNTERATILAGGFAAAFVVSSLMVALIYPFAVRGIVLDHLSAIQSVRHSWRIVRHNIGSIVWFTLLFLLVTLALWVVTNAVLSAVIPFDQLAYWSLTMAIAGEGSSGSYVAKLILVLVLALYALPFVVPTAWQSATFTLGYLQWTGKDVLVDPAAPPPAPLV
jgi:hypothetical protein